MKVTTYETHYMKNMVLLWSTIYETHYMKNKVLLWSTIYETHYMRNKVLLWSTSVEKEIVTLPPLFIFFYFLVFFIFFFWPFFFLFGLPPFFSFFSFWDNALLNDDHHTFIYLQLNDYNSILKQSMTLYGCLRRCSGICNEPRVTSMKKLWMVVLP